jgi:hypothetical protein
MIAAEDVTKFTSADLALMPDDGKRREIIEGDHCSLEIQSNHLCFQVFLVRSDHSSFYCLNEFGEGDRSI